MITVNFTFFDLPYLASLNGNVAIEINEDWEGYQIGDAGTQTLDLGVGYLGSWTPVPNWFGIHGNEPWDYVVGDAGTQDLGGGFGFAGSWDPVQGLYAMEGTDKWTEYQLAVYGPFVQVGSYGTNAPAGVGLNGSNLSAGGFWTTGTWYVQQQYFAVAANDGWYDYSYGDAGTQTLNSGTGFDAAWV